LKLKYFLIVLLFLLMSLSIAEIFPIAPKGSFWYPWYKSDYFSEIDRRYKTVIDAFLAMKTSGNAERAWIFLDEMKSRSGISIAVFNTRGENMKEPGIAGDVIDPVAKRLALSGSAEAHSEIRNGNYYSAIPVPLEKKCRICHNSGDAVAGVVTLEQPVGPMTYFSAERKLLFSVIALICAALIFLLLRWDPDRKINELLGKQR
jgi:hypothetical protein